MHIKTPPSRLCCVKYTAFYLHSDKQSLSLHTTAKKGEMTSLSSVSHTRCEWIHGFLESEAIVSVLFFSH